MERGPDGRMSSPDYIIFDSDEENEQVHFLGQQEQLETRARKKKRRINRTGFPRKKKRPATAASKQGGVKAADVDRPLTDVGSGTSNGPDQSNVDRTPARYRPTSTSPPERSSSRGLPLNFTTDVPAVSSERDADRAHPVPHFWGQSAFRPYKSNDARQVRPAQSTTTAGASCSEPVTGGGDLIPPSYPSEVAVDLGPLAGEGFFCCGAEVGRCRFRSQFPAEFQLHLAARHGSDAQHVCVHCGTRATSVNGLLKHLDEHANQSLQCLYGCPVKGGEYCDYRGKSPSRIAEHASITHCIPAAQLTFICWHCSDCFDSPVEFENHVKKNVFEISCCPHCSAIDVSVDRILQHIHSKHSLMASFLSTRSVLVCKERRASDWPLVRGGTSRARLTPYSLCSRTTTGSSTPRDVPEARQTDQGQVPCPGLGLQPGPVIVAIAGGNQASF